MAFTRVSEPEPTVTETAAETETETETEEIVTAENDATCGGSRPSGYDLAG